LIYFFFGFYWCIALAFFGGSNLVLKCNFNINKFEVSAFK